MLPAGISAEPMGLQWSHDIKVRVHKGVIITNYVCTVYVYVTANDAAMQYILHTTLTMITFLLVTWRSTQCSQILLSPHAGDAMHPALRN